VVHLRGRSPWGTLSLPGVIVLIFSNMSPVPIGLVESPGDTVANKTDRCPPGAISEDKYTVLCSRALSSCRWLASWVHAKD